MVWATMLLVAICQEKNTKTTASPVLTKCWNWELTLATNFGSHAQMLTKFGGQILVLYQTVAYNSYIHIYTATSAMDQWDKTLFKDWN